MLEPSALAVSIFHGERGGGSPSVYGPSQNPDFPYLNVREIHSCRMPWF